MNIRARFLYAAGALTGLLSLLLSSLSPDRSQQPQVTLALLGDVMLGRGVASVYAGGGWEAALEFLAPELANADLALANLESPFSERPLLKEAYDLRANSNGLSALTSTGIDLLALANNHSLDCGIAGLEDTLAALDKAGLSAIGPGPQPVYRQVNGIQLAFLAFDDISAPLDISAAADVIRGLDENGSLVVASVHWGGEYQPAPTQRQHAIAQAMADAGAVLVWGHHPHVIQPVKWFPRRGGTSSTLVVFSLGNTLFDQSAPPDALRSALLLVDLTGQGVQAVRSVPFKIDPRRGRVSPAGQIDASKIEDRLQLTGSR